MILNQLNIKELFDSKWSPEIQDGEVFAEILPSPQAQGKADDTADYIIEISVEDFESTEIDQQAIVMIGIVLTMTIMMMTVDSRGGGCDVALLDVSS
ncbi:hypothetical protein CQW23_03195 [Capsicum baccatum]|uniref:Uncharacterized protein n=1 Tax=Capsicum baccatum TaxID=33114 RepID=A0A2G2XB75_CAPBA|nr:hypothetical protein CQW23_03195 [Capsicum baccatum]